MKLGEYVARRFSSQPQVESVTAEIETAGPFDAAVHSDPNRLEEAALLPGLENTPTTDVRKIDRALRPVLEPKPQPIAFQGSCLYRSDHHSILFDCARPNVFRPSTPLTYRKIPEPELILDARTIDSKATRASEAAPWSVGCFSPSISPKLSDSSGRAARVLRGDQGMAAVRVEAS